MADRIENNTAQLRHKMAKLDMADDLQQKIDDQIRMREGAMKLMTACSTLNQALETSKNLLTINARILGLMSALQKQKKQHVLEEYNRQRSSACSESLVDVCTGRVALSDIRVPLMWRDNVHFTGKTGDQSYYAFALIRCGDQVRDTPLYEVTSADTDMYFDQTLIFEELTPDFKMDLEVYYTVISSHEVHGIRTPIRTPMNLRTPKKSIQFKAPKFCLAGHAQLTVDDIKKGIISMDLGMGGKGASGVAVLGDIHEFPIHPMELWGQVCCQLAAQPKCMLEEAISGYCHVQVDNQWVEYFCKVYQSAISCWSEKALSKNTKPTYVMSFTNVMEVSQPDVTENQPDFIINIISTNGTTLHSLKFEGNTACLKWKYAVKQAVTNFSAWKQACNEIMYIQEVKKRRLSIPTTASFYDQIKTSDITNNGSLYKATPNGNSLVNTALNSNRTTPPLDNIDEKSESVKTEKASNDSSATSTTLSCANDLPQQNPTSQNPPDMNSPPQKVATPSTQETTNSATKTSEAEVAESNKENLDSNIPTVKIDVDVEKSTESGVDESANVDTESRVDESSTNTGSRVNESLNIDSDKNSQVVSNDESDIKDDQTVRTDEDVTITTEDVASESSTVNSEDESVETKEEKAVGGTSSYLEAKIKEVEVNDTPAAVASEKAKKADEVIVNEAASACQDPEVSKNQDCEVEKTTDRRTGTINTNTDLCDGDNTNNEDVSEVGGIMAATEDMPSNIKTENYPNSELCQDTVGTSVVTDETSTAVETSDPLTISVESTNVEEHSNSDENLVNTDTSVNAATSDKNKDFADHNGDLDHAVENRVSQPTMELDAPDPEKSLLVGTPVDKDGTDTSSSSSDIEKLKIASEAKPVNMEPSMERKEEEGGTGSLMNVEGASDEKLSAVSDDMVISTESCDVKVQSDEKPPEIPGCVAESDTRGKNETFDKTATDKFDNESHSNHNANYSLKNLQGTNHVGNKSDSVESEKENPETKHPCGRDRTDSQTSEASNNTELSTMESVDSSDQSKTDTNQTNKKAKVQKQASLSKVQTTV